MDPDSCFHGMPAPGAGGFSNTKCASLEIWLMSGKCTADASSSEGRTIRVGWRAWGGAMLIGGVMPGRACERAVGGATDSPSGKAGKSALTTEAGGLSIGASTMSMCTNGPV
eukprot:3936872-Rhodomonas_salina.2